jgi:hypothetical protein
MIFFFFAFHIISLSFAVSQVSNAWQYDDEQDKPCERIESSILDTF